MEDTPPSPAPSTAHSRAIRSYAQREDAERAREMLADSNIGCTIKEFRVPDPLTGKPVTRGCSLFIDPAQASDAARLLLKMPPSDAPSAATAQPAGPTRLRRRPGPRPKQKSTIFIIAFAILCAAGMIIFATSGILGSRKKPPQSRENILIEEDLNGDTLPDVIREFTWNWIPLYHSEDRNYDSMIDHSWIYQQGRAAYREIDLNYDGKIDERTTFDKEGQPFYTDTRPGASGPVLVRKIFRDGILWKILEDRDADSHFDHITELDDKAEPVRDEALPKGSPENNPPTWPPPPAPYAEDDDSGEMKVNAGK